MQLLMKSNLFHMLRPNPIGLQRFEKRFNGKHRIIPASFTARNVPLIQSLIDLSRIKRPTGLFLLYFPCAWSTQLGTYQALLSSPFHMPTIFSIWNPKLFFLFLTGALLMRTAGCILNDLCDRKIDVLVDRTKHRPLASGALGRSTAIKFMAVCCAGGLGVLYFLPPSCAVLALASVVPSSIYPLMKRVTYYPQLVLGISFNWGALLGYPSVLLETSGPSSSIMELSSFLPVILPLYLGGILWTMIYDTIYAHQDIKDDLKIGVKSTAIKFGEKYTRPILVCFSFLSILSFNVAGWMNGNSPLFFSILNGALLPFLLWQVTQTNYRSATSCWKMFSVSNYFGLAFFLLILLDTAFLFIKKRNQKSENQENTLFAKNK